MAKSNTKRRGKGEGTVYQAPNGGWRGQCQVGCNADGKPKRVSVSGKNRTEVTLLRKKEKDTI